MTTLSFELLLARVLTWWPEVIDLNEGNVDAQEGFRRFGEMYDTVIDKAAQASGSRLLIQLDWIICSTLCKALKLVSVVHLKELRKDHLESCLHELLYLRGLPQLEGKAYLDGAYDLKELAEYFKTESWFAFLKEKELAKVNGESGDQV